MKRIAATILMLSLFIFWYPFPAFAAPANIVRIGNPGLKQFPKNDSEDSFARSVWDMQYYNGSIYVGVGDFADNRGPIDVWSFDADEHFRKEYTVDEEQVDIFREYDGKLFIPGMDARESWAYGNLYIKDSGSWQKLRTIPNGIHVYDVGVFAENIYVIMSSPAGSAVMESSDNGQSWRKLPINDGASFRQMVALDDFLIILGFVGRKSRVYRYSKGNLETLVIPLFPDGNAYPHRSTRFRNGILYTSKSSDLSLFFLNNPSSGVVTSVTIDRFRGAGIRDIVVRNDTCYVMTASEMGNSFQGAIFASTTLDSWTELATFTAPALPNSLELLDGTLYVGLRKSRLQVGVAAEAGSIYRVDSSYPWDVNKDRVVNISDLTLVVHLLGKVVTVPLDPNADVNDDGKVDIHDIILVAQHFGEVY